MVHHRQTANTKDKEKNFNIAIEEDIYRLTMIQITTDFSSETMGSEDNGKLSFKVLKKNCQPRPLYPEKTCFKVKGEIDIFALRESDIVQ